MKGYPAAQTQKEQFPVQSPRMGAAAQPRGNIERVEGCAAEPLPAAETGEAEQGQRSAFCKRPPRRAAKTGYRNPEGLDKKSSMTQQNNAAQAWEKSKQKAQSPVSGGRRGFVCLEGR